MRRENQELGGELYDQQVAARRVLGGAYDPKQGFELAAVSGDTPRNFKPLEEQVDQTVKLLRVPVVEEPTVKLSGVGSRIAAPALADSVAELEPMRITLLQEPSGRPRRPRDGAQDLVGVGDQPQVDVDRRVAPALEDRRRSADEIDAARGPGGAARASRNRSTRRASASSPG